MLGDQQEKERGKRKFLNGETDATSSELHPPVRWRLGARETLSSSGGDRAVRPPRSLVLGVREACFWCHLDGCPITLPTVCHPPSTRPSEPPPAPRTAPGPVRAGSQPWRVDTREARSYEGLPAGSGM
ncbi:uncharacterized protein LOC118721433 isoform X9 [Pipistrellus kuhlii]|uniref:uncharacterized protein LOC118721433 isoform X9 n=1 Tax=Pipistrellus kuhlii TaxID=59472 RepID=UPI001E26E993|nr:uncharacterized protein LOC118721433 isoform X9 [Pipistrellus kuhlii]